MKRFLSSLVLLLLFFTSQIFAQTNFPTFLQGTWKMENGETYERWDIQDNGSLKGTSYRLVNDKEVTSEYLEIRQRGELIIYIATVPDQNDGKGVEFVLHQPDSVTFSFENPEHDFPKKIIYQKRSDSEIYVSVTGDGEQGFSFTMKEVNSD